MGVDYSMLNPLAYGFAEDGKMHVKLRWQLMEGAEHANTIGKELVDFAFCGEDSLHDVLKDVSDRFARLSERQPDAHTVAHALLEGYQPWLERNLYFSIYLMSFFDFLASGIIDRRIYTGASAAERALLGWDDSEASEGSSDVIGLIDQAYGVKRGTAEAALRMIYERPKDSSLTPLEQYYQYEQSIPEFQNQLHSGFTVKLGLRGDSGTAVVPLTELAAIDDLIRYELFLLLMQGKGYKICKNCGRPFIPYGRSDILYCDRVMKGAKRPCREIGANIAGRRKAASGPVWKAYRTAYQRLHKRVEMGYMVDKAFAEWRDEATRRRDLCLAGGLEREEFIAWIDRTSRRRG